MGKASTQLMPAKKFDTKPSVFKAKNVKKNGTKKTKSLPETDAKVIENKTAINYLHVVSGVNAVFKISERQKVATRFLDEEPNIHLYITALKVPKCNPLVMKIKMVNSLLTDESEICLITPDLKNEDPKNHDKNIDFYERFLEENGVTQKISVLPYHQMRTEYLEYEMQKRLVQLYDRFIIDGRISGFVNSKFYCNFYNKHKTPISVSMKGNIQQKINDAILKEEMHIHSNGNVYAIRVGHTAMRPIDVVENVMKVYEYLQNRFPGGFENVQSLHLRLEQQGVHVPIYMTLKSNSNIPEPIVKMSLPKHAVPVEGELSTIETFHDVVVSPGAKVYIKGEMKKKSSLKTRKFLKTKSNGSIKKKVGIASKIKKKKENSIEDEKKVDIKLDGGIKKKLRNNKGEALIKKDIDVRKKTLKLTGNKQDGEKIVKKKKKSKVSLQ